MDITSYFERIEYKGKHDITIDTLRLLHQHHVIHVPYENLDVHLGREIKLTGPGIYSKVVEYLRGGFCYELNFLFYSLLQEMGYQCTIISARVFDVHGQPGPMFDHMCILIDLGDKYLADVGFGDLFLQPVRMGPEVQSDGRNYFRIEPYADEDYVLSMSTDKKDFVKKYIFNTKPEVLDHFSEQCRVKQYSPDSYFVQNKVCTRATADGRETIFNDKFIITKDRQKTEHIIADGSELNGILKSRFNISI